MANSVTHFCTWCDTRKENTYQYDTGLSVQWVCIDCRNPQDDDLPSCGDPFARMKAFQDLR